MGYTVRYFKQFHSIRKFGITCQIPLYNHRLVELAHLHTVRPKLEEESAQTVADYPVNDKTIRVQPGNTFPIIGYRFISYKFVP